ncbi:hypothetical protein BH11PLA2_BH11PLA2_33270 [soil metagenome]
MSLAVLRLENVYVRYGAKTAVNGVSFSVHRGEIVGLLGPNGSGKSSTLAVAAGLLDPGPGHVTANGFDAVTQAARFAAQIGFVPQDTALYDELTAVQNLDFFGKLQGLRGHDLDSRVTRALSRARLSDRADCRVRTFSGGMKQRLSIVCALLHDPAVLLLDEPTASLDATSRDSLFGELQRLRDDGHAILFSTHHKDEAEPLCDRIALLAAGELKSLGQLRSLPVNRALLYGHLRDELPKYICRGLQERLNVNGVEVEVIGRRVRIAAGTSDDLGRALAAMLAEGATLETFRSTAQS